MFIKKCNSLCAGLTFFHKKNHLKHKDSSVNESFVIAMVEGIVEDYDNVKEILDLLKLDLKKFPIFLNNDLKMDLIILGLMSASSSYPCPFCEICHDFKTKVWTKGMPRTLKRIRFVLN